MAFHCFNCGDKFKVDLPELTFVEKLVCSKCGNVVPPEAVGALKVMSSAYRDVVNQLIQKKWGISILEETRPSRGYRLPASKSSYWNDHYPGLIYAFRTKY